jgi:hypothetical protein
MNNLLPLVRLASEWPEGAESIPTERCVPGWRDWLIVAVSVILHTSTRLSRGTGLVSSASNIWSGVISEVLAARHLKK